MKYNGRIKWPWVMVSNLAIWATAIIMVWSLFCAAPAKADQDDDQWKFSVTPYIWGAGFSGTMRYPLADTTPEVDVDRDSELDMALLIGAEASKGRWSILTDIVYLDLSSDASSVTSVDFAATGNGVDGSVDAGSSTEIKGMVWSLAGGSMLKKSKAVEVQSIFGFRYLGLDIETNWNMSTDVTDPRTNETFQRSGSASGHDDIWDLIFGLRGRFNLGESDFYIPYYIDIGTWTSELTWQGMLGLGYRISDWGEVMLDYRYLSYDFDYDQVIQELVVQGPAIGFKFKF